ncbi:excinuclease ABC subunit UvrC [Sporolactobacillus terrae]|uniref:excinuclease ABC subunit UvrC n=1 Tax=Sporolactobacillus terrae TaxID=269673 RepID=UPI0006849717|nr:excinuclease ABC subunit UvrC [Sporolactobacillus terrae]
MNPAIRDKLSLLPKQPGCYLMEDHRGTVIYVGKAKILKRRVRSYFIGKHNPKTEKLVSQIANFTFIVTASDVDTLILENNLIKNYHPKYNILLKDDKSYPYIKITDERHPRLIITRQVSKDQGRYFGPFPNVSAANETKALLDRLYPLRRCPLSAQRPCLYYQIGRCIGCCAREVSEEEYRQVTRKIVHFFNGGFRAVARKLKEEMREASDRLNFEKAQELHDLISCIEATMDKQSINNLDFVDRDVFGYAFQEGWLCVQVFHIRCGKLMQRAASFFPVYAEPETSIRAYLGQFYLGNHQIKPKEILMPELDDEKTIQEFLGIRLIHPQRGTKKNLVQMACQNARVALQNKLSLSGLKSTGNRD